MSMEMIRAALGWCTLINWGLLLWWWLFIAFGHDWVFRMHGMWFKKLSRETFDTIHYSGMMAHKVLIVFVYMIPYLVLRLFL